MKRYSNAIEKALTRLKAEYEIASNYTSAILKTAASINIALETLRQFQRVLHDSHFLRDSTVLIFQNPHNYGSTRVIKEFVWLG